MKFQHFVLILLTSLFFLYGCSSSQNAEIDEEIPENLYQISSRMDSSVLWTRELESVRLLTDINKASQVVSSIKLTPITINTSEIDFYNVYPEIKDFGSLDLSSVSEDLFQFIQTICSNISEMNISEIKTDSPGTASLIFFKNDLMSNWKNWTGRKFPVITASAKSDKTEKNEKSDKAKKSQEKLFNSWIIGKPFESDDVSIFPVRFYAGEKILDCHIYINVKSDYKFSQIQLIDWGTSDGK